ncbi:hypothetical protein K491DRAFT_683753 [Lophiostoma macrostomum CBS 122681]|uniref:Uncharacterized protein n=1 Tax=Lophiostoma macrostomum CBS 122681 TaxID=1314788 RepID=A0A6A6SPY1_9PLEO|nr:hypothetical protein K491DRAFT_683753 [Lophiostoma macrostomum CBS 122681]
MYAAEVYSRDLRFLSKKRYGVYLFVTASAVICSHILSGLSSVQISASSSLPLLFGYAAHTFLDRQRGSERSLKYCVLLSAALLALRDVIHLINLHLVLDPIAMTDIHLAVTHFGLAFLFISETEYLFCADNTMLYPDAFMAPQGNLVASYFPNVPISRCFRCCWSRNGKVPPPSVAWRAIALDMAMTTLWHVGIWRFNSLIQAWLNPNYAPPAGIKYRPLTTLYGFEVIWTSRGMGTTRQVGSALLQAAMMRPIRILNSYLFAWGADFLVWLRSDANRDRGH